MTALHLMHEHIQWHAGEVMGEASPAINEVFFTGCFTCSLRGIPLAASPISAARTGILLTNPYFVAIPCSRMCCCPEACNACACDTMIVVWAPTCLIMQRYKMSSRGVLEQL